MSPRSMIAAHAMDTMALPRGPAVDEADIMDRTVLLALSTADTGVGCVELVVGDDKAVEERPQQIGLRQGKCTAEHLIMIAGTFRDQVRNPGQIGPDSIDFPLRILRGIQGKTRKSQIGFRHLQAETGIQRKPCFPQGTAEDLPGIIALVAASAGEPHISGAVAQIDAANEIEHEMRRRPRVDGKNEAQRLSFPQSQFRFGIGNEQQRLPQVFRQRFSHPSAVAAT